MSRYNWQGNAAGFESDRNGCLTRDGHQSFNTLYEHIREFSDTSLHESDSTARDRPRAIISGVTEAMIHIAVVSAIAIPLHDPIDTRAIARVAIHELRNLYKTFHEQSRQNAARQEQVMSTWRSPQKYDVQSTSQAIQKNLKTEGRHRHVQTLTRERDSFRARHASTCYISRIRFERQYDRVMIWRDSSIYERKVKSDPELQFTFLSLFLGKIDQRVLNYQIYNFLWLRSRVMFIRWWMHWKWWTLIRLDQEDVVGEYIFVVRYLMISMIVSSVSIDPWSFR